MLIKGSETCNAQALRITGEMMGSMDADDSLSTTGEENNMDTSNEK